jgi:repressor LexA
MEELTGRQREILHFIVRQTEERGFPPTIREIGEEMDIRSTNGVNDHLKALERKGYLLRGEQQSRALVPTKRARLVLGMGAPRRDIGMVEVPLLGKVAAGAPLLAVENVEDSVRIDSFLLGGNGREVFALRVKGDSMVDDGIHDGDYLFVRKTPSAREGDIVVALIEDEATCKRYYPEGERIRFQPANKAMAPIYVHRSHFRSTMILGQVVGVYRKVH